MNKQMIVRLIFVCILVAATFAFPLPAYQHIAMAGGRLSLAECSNCNAVVTSCIQNGGEINEANCQEGPGSWNIECRNLGADGAALFTVACALNGGAPSVEVTCLTGRFCQCVELTPPAGC
jgi:hypothetical protein